MSESFEEIYDNLKKESEITERVKRKQIKATINKQKRIARVKKIAALVLAAGIVVGAGSLIVEKGGDISYYQEVMHGYEEILDSETYIIKNGNNDFWYNNANIASKLLDTDNIDHALYGIYTGMNDNDRLSSIDVNKNMNEVTRMVSSFDGDNTLLGNDYNTFESYVIDKGYVTKYGGPDYTKYSEDMKQQIIDQKDIEDNIKRGM